MQYKVVPFVALITQKDSAAKASAQLEALAAEFAKDGWEYVRLESVETRIASDDGCMGLGATPARTTSVSMAVFRK